VATLQDVPAMAAMRARNWETEEFWQARIGGYLRGSHSPQQALRERAAYVAEEEGRLAGFVAGHRTRRYECDGELQWIDVGAEHRGRGVADKLMQAMGAWFAEQDSLRVCVNVAAENVAARRLYARHGAVSLSENWMIWEDARAMGGVP
jgi:GNAT superfamily N-acetyltransferase